MAACGDTPISAATSCSSLMCGARMWILTRSRLRLRRPPFALSCRRLESREGTLRIGRALASAMLPLAKRKQAFQSGGLTN